MLVPLLMLGYNNLKANKLALSALEKVDLLDRVNNLPSQLSGGQQQRVSIARAIVNNPKILFADEPTANLDSVTARTIMKAFKELNKMWQTIILVTHESEYTRMSKKVIKLSDGKIS